MKGGISKSISKAVYIYIFVCLIYIVIQFFIYFPLRNIIRENQDTVKMEYDFYNIINNAMGIESSFLNYSFGYHPSPNKFVILLEENNKLLNSFILAHPSISSSRNIEILESNFEELYKMVLIFVSIENENTRREILLKDINEIFFINRLSFLKVRNIIHENSNSNFEEIEKALKFSLITLLLLSLTIALVIFYSFYLKRILIEKITYLQKTISSFSAKKNYIEEAESVEYNGEDEFKIVFETFNNMIKTISRQNNDLLQNEKKYRYLFDNSTDAFIVLNIGGKFTDCNSAAIKMFGYSIKEDLVNSNPVGLSPKFQSDGSLSSEKIMELLNVADREGGKFLNWTFFNKNKDIFNATVLLSKIEIEGETVFFATIRDISKQKIEEEKRIQSQKMASIGTLAGGIAHDFNNMLSGIMASAQLLRMPKRNLDEKGIKYVDMIMQASIQAAELTDKLLLFGRKGSATFNTIDIYSIIDDTIDILSKTIDKKIQIVTNKESVNHIVEGDRTQIQNIFMNLAINGSHAMINGGELSLTTKNIIFDGIYCENSQFDITPGEYLEIEVRDSGCGISFENQKRIFEPFFTTKKQGKGTGLGLAAVYGTVLDHSGVISVESEMNHGTVFHVYLPVSTKGKSSVVNKMVERNKNLFLGSGNILLVDDEEIIRTTGMHILEDLGYSVMLASNGREGVDLFRSNHEKIDLVILDMIMPKMNGREAFTEIMGMDRNCKIILSSGYTKDENIDEMKKHGLSGYIRKPFQSYELSQLLFDILNKQNN